MTLADTQIVAQGSFAAIRAFHCQSWAAADNDSHGFADRAPNWIALIGLIAVPNHVVGPATFDPATNSRWVASLNVVACLVTPSSFKNLPAFDQNPALHLYRRHGGPQR